MRAKQTDLLRKHEKKSVGFKGLQTKETLQSYVVIGAFHRICGRNWTKTGGFG